jgi:hypothetical protein
MKNLLVLLVVGGLLWFGYGRHRLGQGAVSGDDVAVASTRSFDARSAPGGAPRQFTCDGRTHCSQMRSCAEATFFVQHCPNTKMDGDNDGVPCEQQWCN